MPFRDIRVVPIRVVGEKVHTALNEEVGCLGLRVDGEAPIGEILGDLGQCGGLACAGTAGEYDVGDLLHNTISTLYVAIHLLH